MLPQRLPSIFRASRRCSFLLGLALWACSDTRAAREPISEARAEMDAKLPVEIPPPSPAAAASEPPDLRVLIASLSERAVQGDEDAETTLRDLLVRHAEGPVGDHAALVLGNLLLEELRPSDAVPVLLRASRGAIAPDYARLLLADAVVRGRATATFEETRELLLEVLGRAGTPHLERGTRLRLLRLESAAQVWDQAVQRGRDLLSLGVPAGQLDEVRWLTAEALGQANRAQEAAALYRELWHQAPGSPWGTQARDRLVAAGVEAEPSQPRERLRWVERLQRSGLHRDALGALGPLLAGQVEAELRARATFLAVHSHLALRENDETVARARAIRRASPRSPWAAKAAIAAMRALGRQDRTNEIRAWEEWVRTVHRGTEAAGEARYYLGSYLGGVGKEEQALRILRELAERSGPRTADALWRIAWLERRRGRDAAARRSLERLVERGSAFRPAALYWLARLAEADGPRARALFLQVRRERPRDYYGRLATARLLERGETLPPLSSAAKLGEIDQLRDPLRRPEPAYRRAVELRELGLDRLAADELESIAAGDDRPLRLALARLHARGGDAWTAIGEVSAVADALAREPLSSGAVPRAVWKTLYPFPYRGVMAAAADRRSAGAAGLEPSLVAAVARRESRFRPRAVSPAGAIGLLQLTPETAARTAGQLGQAPPGRIGLFDPATNIELGTAHLATLLQEFGGAIPPALASYNAGELVVRRWWAERPHGQALDEWIETIPYLETRLYVKAILADWISYRELYEPGGDETAVAILGEAAGLGHLRGVSQSTS